jgi:hypothetical protein
VTCQTRKLPFPRARLAAPGHDVLRIEGPNGAAIDKHQILLERQPARARPRGWRAWRLARRTLESRMSHRPAARKAGPQNLPR